MITCAIELFDQETIDYLEWPETEEGQNAKNYLVPLVKNGAAHYFANAKTEVAVLTIDDLILPITINDGNYENSYVCSPYTHYVNCAIEKLHWALKSPFSIFKGALKRSEINKVVFVNNWLFSTNLYPKISKSQVEQIIELLIEKYPNHAIGFRSLTKFENGELFNTLKNMGCELVASRPIFFLDTSSSEPFKSRMFKSDLKILKKSEYEVVNGEDLPKEDLPRILSLYNALYLDKYSKYNPHLTLNFLELALKNKILNIRALKKEGRVDAVMGYFAKNGTATSPLFGYDTTLPQNLGLYRQISTILTLEAKERGFLLNQSAGATSFKKLRRAKSEIEYTAIYSKHLPFFRRLPWKLLRNVINGFGVPIMKRMNL